MKSKTIVKFTKNDEGVSATVYGTETVNILIGIAQTIQIISGQSKKDNKSILSDISKILNILEEKKEETKNE